MLYRRITDEISVPERTAELADKHPGVRKVLEAGFVVLSYLDKREIEAAQPISEYPPEIPPDLTLAEKWDMVKRRIEENRKQGEQ